FSSFKMTKENYKYQILYAVLLVFLIYMPIDFLSYSIPGVMDFSLNALLSSENPTELDINGYLRFTNIIPFLLYVVIIQFCVGFREELYFRGILVSRGRKYMKPNNTIIVSSFIFGMSHFVYYSEMPQGAQSLFYSILWAVTAFIVGFAAATFFLKKRYILSIIIAHSINNIISTTALWMRRNLVLDFINIALRLYVPLLLVSLFLLIFYRQIVKNGLAEGKRVLSDYIKTAGTTTGGKLKIISADILIGILILMMGIFMF
ncbi:MAG: lysostaphin resistance A-like protein, partial [Promethearchaeota archaeon]